MASFMVNNTSIYRSLCIKFKSCFYILTQMKQFVANDLRVMEAQTKAVSLHISASEVIRREKGSQLETQLEIEHALISGRVGQKETR